MTAKPVRTHLLLPDLHFPAHNKPAWAAVLDFAALNKIDGVVFTGDQLDNEEISHWNKSRPLLRKEGSFKRNLDDFKSEILDPLEAVISPDCEKTWITGNHERFISDLYEEMPELSGMLDLNSYLELDSRGWKVLPQGGMHKIGHLRVIHGDQVGSNIHIAKKLVESYGCNVAMGHVHAPSSFTKVAAVSQDSKWTGTCLPTLGTINPRFARNRPNGHVNGFGIVEQLGKSFNLFTVIVTDGGFAYGGVPYGRAARKVAA